MKNPALDNLRNRLDELENQIDEIEIEELEEKVYQLEEDLNAQKYDSFDYKEDLIVEKLTRRINQIKKENDFYDEEAELDNMFPDRHDPDFDEDSMSYDSVFGGD